MIAPIWVQNFGDFITYLFLVEADMQIDQTCHTCALRKVATTTGAELNCQDNGAFRLCADLRTIDEGVVLDKSICAKGDMVAICNGVLGLQHTLPDGRRSLTELFMRGDLVVKNRVPADAQIIALAQTRICCLPMKNLNLLEATNKELKEIFAERLGKQSSQLCIHCADVAMKTPPERLASFLCEYCDRDTSENPGAKDMCIQLSRTDIASYIASEPETVSRSFSKLMNAGAIEMNGRYNLTVSDKEKLQKIADGGLPRQRRNAMV